MACNLIPFEKIIPARQVTEIAFSFHKTALGDLSIASVSKGLCRLDIGIDQDNFIQSLEKQFPEAVINKEVNSWHVAASEIIRQSYSEDTSLLPLHPFGTPFQYKVWEELLSIPFGSTSTYQALSDKLGIKGGSRAIGTAIGSNPIALLIPCHRVLRSDGGLGGFRWGLELKRKLLLLEGIRTSSAKNTSQYSLF